MLVFHCASAAVTLFSSHWISSSFASWREHRPPFSFVSRHESTRPMWFMVCWLERPTSACCRDISPSPSRNGWAVITNSEVEKILLVRLWYT